MTEWFDDKNIVFYACSGASDVGEIADRAARKLRSEGIGSMSCLSGIGAKSLSLIKIAKTADVAVVIDGCSKRCGKKIFKRNNLDSVCLGLNEFDFHKGKTPVTDKAVAKAAIQGKAKLPK